jgi:molybdopterin-guanine dinucleotide biosynthesis protein A
MGTAKAWIPIGPETMLQRMVRILGEVVRPVVVSSRAGQELPDLPPWAHVVCDRHEDCGPMEGLAAALEWLQDRAELAFVAGCDAPLLRPAFVRRMLDLAGGFDIAVPHLDGFDEPLTAVYRVRLAADFRAALEAGERRIAAIFDRVATRRVTADELRDVDPDLESLLNINDPAAYRAVQERLAAAERN